MVKQTLTFLLLLALATGFAQQSEFGNTNGTLLYSPTAIQQLKHIVDSIHLQFAKTDLNSTYQSLPTVKANYITITGSNAKNAEKDIAAQIPFTEFTKKYPEARIETRLPVLKSLNEYGYNHTGAEIVFSTPETKQLGIKHYTVYPVIGASEYNSVMKDKWVYQYEKNTGENPASVSAFYFVEEFSTQPLPAPYARMVQYADCMIDTSASLFNENVRLSEDILLPNDTSKAKKFLQYVYAAINRTPASASKTDDATSALWGVFDRLPTDSLRKNDPCFMQLLTEAIQQVKKRGGGNETFAAYVERYCPPKTLLDVKRSYIVEGVCSRDPGPRQQLWEIAQLSAATASWNIFVRAHLDIMNDQAFRLSDVGYMQTSRKTYIRELEALNINVPDLLLGITLRINNPAQQHYYGYTDRLGMALSETSHPRQAEAGMLQIISDNRLDVYNRLLVCQLFTWYNYYLPNKTQQEINRKKLKAAIQTLPPDVATKINI